MSDPTALICSSLFPSAKTLSDPSSAFSLVIWIKWSKDWGGSKSTHATVPAKNSTVVPPPVVTGFPVVASIKEVAETAPSIVAFPVTEMPSKNWATDPDWIKVLLENWWFPAIYAWGLFVIVTVIPFTTVWKVERLLAIIIYS